MPLDLKLPYQLRTGDFDRYQHLKPASMLDIFQDIAGLQADGMGIGQSLMESGGVFWAVVRMKCEVVKQPPLHASVTARTWPYDPSRFIFYRDYSMHDESGELLVRATSEWALMDLKTRSLAKIADHCPTDEAYFADRSFPERIRRVPGFKVEQATQPAYVVVPQESDVDLNGHVNNARYAAFAYDALGIQADETIRQFQIDYKHEVLKGQPLSVWVKRDGEHALVSGVNEGGEVAFACEVHFESAAL